MILASHITLSTRVTGVCKTCKQLKNALHASKDEQRLKGIMEELRIHLRAAIEQRKVYKERVKIAIDAWEDDADLERLTIACEMTACIAFDYASSAHLPSIVRSTIGLESTEEVCEVMVCGDAGGIVQNHSWHQKATNG